MQRPRILHIFSRYGDVGGEEVCFRAITEELRAVADVTPFVYSTAELFQSPHGALTKMRYMLRNRDVEEKLRECLRRDRYDAWIIHNTFPAMSPCVYGLALKQSVPVIHYLHNYRAASTGYSTGTAPPASPVKTATTFPASCTPAGAAARPIPPWRPLRCIKRAAWAPGTAFPPTSPSAAASGSSSSKPEYRRTKSGSFPTSSGKKPPPPDHPRRDVLYAGRLTQEKGVLPLVQAWERLAPPGRTLYLMGDGPLRGELERYVAFRRLESIRLTGFIPHEEQGAVRAACGLAVAPSLWEETFGMVVLESWLHGTPVIVTPRGGLPELISHGRNGWIAREPSADALAETLRTALEEEERWPSMGAHGQQLLSSTYSPAAWLQSMGSLLEELRLFRQSPNITAS